MAKKIETVAKADVPEIVVKPPTISFNIGVPPTLTPEYIYICGNIEELGAWEPTRAIRVKRSKRGTYGRTLRFPLGTEFEYKILSDTRWGAVEKGRYTEEIVNRKAVVAEEKNRLIIQVMDFRNE
ncbi:MAG: CBM20 domain-containing protein [Firmicutes bacterium]|nr:CBM20 domain-containing protein [Bacillota bacterium]